MTRAAERVAPIDAATPPVAEQAPGHGTYSLDRELHENHAAAAPYGRSATLAIAATVAIEVGFVALGRIGSTTTRGALSLVGESLIALAAVTAAIPVVRRAGGWRASLGVDLFRRGDIKTTSAWFGLQVATRMAVAYVLIICIPPLRHQRVSNLTGLSHASVPAIVMLAIAAVLIAPFAEELLMRGLVLRASMLRGLNFWPAAVLNALIFGGLHVHEGANVLAGVVLGLSTGAFGFVQCLLVRRTARLTPAMGVHATTNALALLVALVAAHA